jgi:OOP family OmpA-OmpF porin
MKTYMAFVVGCCLCSLFMAPARSAAQDDVPGSKDHPLLTRMPGFYIEDYEEKSFDQADFKNSAGEDIKIEGHIYDIFYTLQEGRTAPGKIQVLRNYENAIRGIGGKTTYRSGEEEWFTIARNGHVTRVYIDARTTGEYQLSIVETEAMKQDVVADAASLARDITATGHATVYGIYFDFNQATVKPESQAALKEIATLLEAHPELKLYVVGHTDGVGEIAYNMKLSLARAQAVVKALVTRHKVAAMRLDPYGVGPLSPVASNETEKGRGLNRRVELVKQ